MDVPVIRFLTVYALRVVVAIAVMLFGRYLAGKARDVTTEMLQRPEVDKAFNSSAESMLVRRARKGVGILGVFESRNSSSA